MTTKAWLEGDAVDLGRLADLLSDGDVRVVLDADRDRYYLTAPEIDQPSEASQFYQSAATLLGRINGLARVRDDSFRPVSLSGIISTPTGEHIFPPPATIEIRGGLVTVEGPGPLPPSPWPDRLALADGNPDVADVLEIMGNGKTLAWADLYKVHEIIRDAIKPDKIHALDWATKADDSAFTASANRADVSGDDARHARNNGTTPARTMTISQGRSYISDLVKSWLGSLAGN